MVVGHQAKHSLTQGAVHTLPIQEHWGCQGHQALLDITEHTDPDVTISVDFEMSTDGGKTWVYGGGWTLAGGDHTVDKNGEPTTYVNTTWGHALEANGEPPARRLVRGVVHILPTRPAHLAGVTIPGAPGVHAFGQRWAPQALARGEHLRVVGTPRQVRTRVHVAGIRQVHLDKSLIPHD